MGLDVYLKTKNPVLKSGTGLFLKENGKTRELTVNELKEKFPDIIIDPYVYRVEYVFNSSITHNLKPMAQEAGIYHICWKPHENYIKKAKDIIFLLEVGYNKLKEDPVYYMQFNSANGYGNYHDLVDWVKEYLDACKKYPHAIIEVGT